MKVLGNEAKTLSSGYPASLLYFTHKQMKVLGNEAKTLSSGYPASLLYFTHK